MAVVFLERACRGPAGSTSAPPAANRPTRSTRRCSPRCASLENIDLAAERPKLLTDGAVREADVDHGLWRCLPLDPGKDYREPGADNPAGQGIDAVRPIRDEISRRIESLIAEIAPA